MLYKLLSQLQSNHFALDESHIVKPTPSGFQCGLHVQRLAHVFIPTSQHFNQSLPSLKEMQNRHTLIYADNSRNWKQFTFCLFLEVLAVFIAVWQINHDNRKWPVLEWTHHQLLHISAVSSFTDTPNILKQERWFALTETGRERSVLSGAPVTSKWPDVSETHKGRGGRGDLSGLAHNARWSQVERKAGDTMKKEGGGI